ncbi:diacylglycerol kinase family protein [Sporosarcina sp. Te-1]|uniref:diacylglycerol kinase family protein n=1 Tax=Sporosarcina sp. Te-1 TaxID=2818390 RepID=UPI001A9EF3D6|nr:diacylglycerol kinase family protein [Sporosarcina sp. Te-1]QTD41664.1 diacylglycerol kinase family protein [Sporosarcina sp. Te-1]
MLGSFIKSFHYAWTGIKTGFAKERNMKFHVGAGLAVVICGLLTGLSYTEWILVIMLIGGMLALELMNTAIERTVDLVTGEYHPLAKQAKDLAAGAVFVYAVASAVVGCILFIPKWFS